MKETEYEENDKKLDNEQEPYLMEKEQNIYNLDKSQNQLEDNNDYRSKRITSFEVELMKAIKKEEEEQQKKKELKEKKEKQKILRLFHIKDYLFLFILLISSSFNFSICYLIYIVIACLYLFFMEKLSIKAKKVKYLCEVFTIGYSCYLFLYKITCLILIENEDQSLIGNNVFYINLGICYLKDRNSSFYYIMTFLSELFVIIISGYSIYISFISRLLKEEDIKYKEIKMLTLRKTILLAYCLIVVYCLFNISFLTLLYIILIQFILLLNSIKINEKTLKPFFHLVVYFWIISSFIQIIFTNILNIYTLQKKILISKDKKYSIYTQIGIKYADQTNSKTIWLSFISYFLSIILLMSFYFIHIELKSGLNIKSEEEVEKIKKEKEMNIIKNNVDNIEKGNNIKNDNIVDNNNISQNKINDKDKNVKDKKEKKWFSLLNLNFIYRLFAFMMSHPNFNYEIERIISILWTYYYRNYFSLGMYLVLFFSFFFVDMAKTRFLVLFILVPILLITIGIFHISNIDGLLNLEKNEQLSQFGLIKFQINYYEQLIGHIYYLTVIFLIYNIYSKKQKKKKENDLKIKNNELLENIIPKKEDKNKEITDEDLYENKSEDSQSDDDSDNELLLEAEELNTIKLELIEPKKKEIKAFSLTKLLIKFFFSNIDKITLVVMYFVSVYTVNVTHVFLVFIFVLQIVIPKQIKYFYKFLIIIFQIVYLIEFVLNLLKDYEILKQYKEYLDLFIIFNEEKFEIEIYLYAVIYCLYFQHITCNLEYIKKILVNESITYESYVTIQLSKLPFLKKQFLLIGTIINHIILWCLAFLFIFFTCFYEVNLIFGIKLLLFFMSLYTFLLITHKKTMNSKFRFKATNHTCYTIWNRIMLIICSLNTFCAFLYQFICKNKFGIIDYIKKSDNFFIKNLPSIGFTLYEEENLYYNFIPHFLTSFVCTLYAHKSEEVLSNLDTTLKKSKTKLILEKKTIKKSEKKSEDKYKSIREEKNEFLQDKMYADKYYENDDSIKVITKRLIKYYIIFLYTKIYWLLLFMSLGIIFSSYDLSFSILLYIIIFGCLFVKKFFKIISKMSRYLSTNSYYISKVIRYSVVEKPIHYELNKYYRSLTFKCCLFLSFLYLILLYFYGIFDLFQHGCNSELYRGCDKSNKSIIDDNLEDKIKAIGLLIGIYINMRKENILNVSLVHLVLSGFIVFDIYNQQIEEHYSIITNDLQKKLQKLTNENNILEKYSEIADYNILIKIGLTLAGIDMSSSESKNNNGGDNMRNNFRMSLKDKFLIKTESVNKLVNMSDTLEKKKSIKNEIQYNIDEDAPENSFLKNIKIKKFIKMIKNSSNNEQKLSIGNSKGKIIIFFKKFFEEVIIFLLICISLGKLNIWTFIYLLITFILIATKRTMTKFYIVFCFIYSAILIQSFLYLSNLTAATSIRDFEDIFKILKTNFNIPWYEDYLTYKVGFFYGLGVTESQVKLICLEFLQIVVIYFYLDLFSYSIYQETLNRGETSVHGQKFDFHTLNLNQYEIDYIQKMTEVEFQEIRECLECFNFKIGKNRQEFLDILQLSPEEQNKNVNNYSKDDDRNKFDFSGIKNSTLKDIIYFRMLNKELRKSMEKKTNSQYKQYPAYLLVIQEILFMYLHFVLLIFIIITSIMIAGLISIIYISISFHYLIKSDALFLGIKYTYPKVLKKVLMIIILLDIFTQGVYSTPFFSQEDDSLGYKILNSIGLIKVVDFGKESNDRENIKIDQNIEVFAKAFLYLLMSLQLLIYDSKSFKKYYLVYLLSHKNESKKSSIINSFTFNNKRVEVFGKSLALRQQSDEAMEDLKNIINELNEKLNKIGKKILSKKSTLGKKPSSNINRVNSEIYNTNNNKDYNSYNLFREKKEKDNENNNEKNDVLVSIMKRRKDEKDNQYLDPAEVEQKIRDIIYHGYLINIYSWFHKQSVSYKNIDINERIDFDIETIQGEVTIKSIIENKLNLALKILDLENIDKAKMKEIELIIEANFDENKKKILEENKRRKILSKNAKAKLKKAFKFAKLISKKYDRNLKDKNNLEGDEINKFKMKQKAEKEYLEQKELMDRKIAEREEYKLKQFEEVLEMKLFKKYLKTSYFIQYILLYLQTFFIRNFNWICYFVMILDHILSSSSITLIYPLSIFCYALLEYPRPKKIYWILVLYYTFFIMCAKFFIQLKIIIMILGEDLYKELFRNLNNFNNGLSYFPSSFSSAFIKYIFFDALIIICVLINRNLLISEGLWFSREEEIENIYEASERITIYGQKKYSNKINAIKDLLFKYLYSPKEMLNMRKKSDADNKEVKDVKHKFPFLIKRNTEQPYNEAERGYFERMFTKNRNEKPGNDFYPVYTLIMALICIYILFFYTNMNQDKTYGPINLDMTQFSGEMVLFLILHIIVLVYDRVIFVTQNREKISYEYIFYKKNPENGQGELLTEIENNQLKSEICKNITRDKFTIIPQKEIEKLKKYFNILFIQKEQFNKPLFNKYILHIFTVLLSHFMIFYYLPIKGNYNLGNSAFCPEEADEAEKCKKSNNFNSNHKLIIFYLLYLLYLIFSGLQVKFGFYDIKRKSFFKKKGDEVLSGLSKGFNAIPFLYEIKNAIDWTFTSTCLTLFQWNKFEAIYDTIFDTYCEKND